MSHTVTAFAPGRVNLIGEHTDYNGGLALPFAIEAGVTVAAALTGERAIDAHARDLGESDEFSLDAPVQRASGWAAFVRGAAGELLEAGIPLAGARLEISGTLPRGGGLSSSAALEVALTLALAALAGSELDDHIFHAKLCSRIENDWVGANTGLLDQLASILGREGHALLIDFRALTTEPVALELGGYRLVTLDSGESHANAASGYNERRRECAQAAEQLGVATLREAGADAAERLPEPLRSRTLHVIGENERVEQTVSALAAGDLERVGALLDASHASLRDLYDVSTPAVEETVGVLKDAGATGARVVGGGFGGNVLALLGPGIEPPAGAVEVRPGPGASVSAAQSPPG